MITLSPVVKRSPIVNRFDTDQRISASHRGVIAEESDTRDLARIYLFIYGGLLCGIV